MQQGGINCRTCWGTIPVFTKYFMIISSIVSIALIISCIATVNWYMCGIQTWLYLTPARVFEYGEVWRLLSCYLINNSFWSVLFNNMAFFFLSLTFEKQVGTLRYVLILLAALLVNSFLICAISAFFGAIPGIANSWTYFRMMWVQDVNVGTMPILILVMIFQVRIAKTKSMMFCCFNMPTWLFTIVLWLSCQCMMFYPWEGIWYNATIYLIGWYTPMKWIVPRAVFINLDEREQPQNSVGNFQAQTQQQVQKQDNIQFTTINQQQKQKPQTFGRNGRTL